MNNITENLNHLAAPFLDFDYLQAKPSMKSVEIIDGAYVPLLYCGKKIPLEDWKKNTEKHIKEHAELLNKLNAEYPIANFLGNFVNGLELPQTNEYIILSFIARPGYNSDSFVPDSSFKSVEDQNAQND